MKIRRFRDEDTEQLVNLFRDTVRNINIRDYTQAQVEAWAPDNIDLEKWRSSLDTNTTFVAESENEIDGFAELKSNGYLDRFYCHRLRQRKGVGRQLLAQIESVARSMKISQLTTDASITAKPFFESMGFTTLREQQVERRGQTFINFAMVKSLDNMLMPENFNGRRFINPWMGRSTGRSFFDVLKWKLTTRAEQWPRWVENNVEPQLPVNLEADQVAITFINHATFLIQANGFNIITDPVYSKRTSPVQWAGPARVRAPGLPFEELPPIHAVLVSHCHYDHMDIPTLKRLQKYHSPIFITGLGNKSYLEKRGFSNVTELDWWQNRKIDEDTEVTFTPKQHFAARTPFDRDKTLWGGFVIKSGMRRICFAGDTGYAEIFKEIVARLGPFDVSLIPIGAYEPRWFMHETHVNPSEAVQLHLDIGSRKSIAMHFGTFQLTDEGIDEPVEKLGKALAEYNVPPEEFIVIEHGETLVL